MGKKIKDKERAEVFGRLRKEIFGQKGLPAEPGKDIISDFRYNRIAEMFGIRSESGEMVYPDNSGSQWDYTSEEGIRKTVVEMANRYAESRDANLKNPGEIRAELWKLFDPKYNPKYEAFAASELAVLKDPNGSSATVTLKNIMDILMHEASGNEAAARTAAKGTLLEDMLSNPVHFASNIQGTLEYRYIESFGYKLDPSDAAYAKQDLFHAWQVNLDPKSKFKESKEVQDARIWANIKNKSNAESSVNSAAASNTAESKPAGSQINSTTSGTASPAPTAGSPINATTPSKNEATSTTSSEGGVTSKTGELQTENILDTTPSQAINVNLENKQAESKPAVSTSPTTNTSTTSNSTTVNDVKSTSTETSSPSNTASSVSETSDKNIMKVENTTNQSSSSTVNEAKPEKQKGGFLAKVGNFAKKAGAALNLPSVAELGGQAKGLFGATAANINSRISEVKESFNTNSSKNEINSAPSASSNNNSAVNSSSNTINKPTVLATPPAENTSNTTNVLKPESPVAMNVEQKLPSMSAAATPPSSTNTSTAATATSTTVTNTANSQTASSPQTTNSTTAQNTQTASQPASNPPGMGVNVDNGQLAQSIQRLERILMNGIEVTIKDA